eukprot:218502-Pyramimonas_sp.AAC.1
MKLIIFAWEIIGPCVGFEALGLTSDACFGTSARLPVPRTKRGGAVCLEWPTPCNYWRGPQVKEFIRELGFVKTTLHRCAHGLKGSKGNLMKKPWTIASTSCDVVEGLERRCDGAHEHVEARGRECKSAENLSLIHI